MQTLNDFVDCGHLVLGENSELLNQSSYMIPLLF